MSFLTPQALAVAVASRKWYSYRLLLIEYDFFLILNFREFVPQSRASRRSGMNPVERMHFRSAIMNSGEFMSSKDAKAEFFLTPDHLKQLPFQKVGGCVFSELNVDAMMHLIAMYRYHIVIWCHLTCFFLCHGGL